MPGITTRELEKALAVSGIFWEFPGNWQEDLGRIRENVCLQSHQMHKVPRFLARENAKVPWNFGATLPRTSSPPSVRFSVGDRFYPALVLGGVVLSLWGCQTPAQYWIKLSHPWVQQFYTVLGLGSGGRLLGHSQTLMLYHKLPRKHYPIGSENFKPGNGNKTRFDKDRGPSRVMSRNSHKYNR